MIMVGAPSKPVVFLMGPTASGKTDLAVDLVRHLPLDVVSVDSAMVYRGMDIGTAKPGSDVLAVAPHRLIDICDPAQAYSAADFLVDARREIESIHASGRIPLFTGGTMLYFQALQRGLSDLPAADPSVRARLEAQARAQGWPALHRRLAARDPDTARRVHPNDPQRIQRALEVYELTGRTLSELCAVPRPRPFPHPLVKLAVVPAERDELHRRISLRFDRMLKRGFLAEVETLRARADLSPDTPAMRAVGYRQAWRCLGGEYPVREMRQRALAATRQLAKRQITWLRSETDALRFASHQTGLLDNVLKTLETKLRLE